MSTFTSAQFDQIANYVALTNPTWEARAVKLPISGFTEDTIVYSPEEIIYRTDPTQPWNSYSLAGFEFSVVTEFFVNFHMEGGGFNRSGRPVDFNGAELQAIADYLQITGVVTFALATNDGRVVVRNFQSDSWISFPYSTDFDFAAAAAAVAAAKG